MYYVIDHATAIKIRKTRFQVFNEPELFLFESVQDSYDLIKTTDNGQFTCMNDKYMRW